ncbi:MAG: HipA domain-containing protein [Chlamydiae bacterium]|nr:HipA domain-containing protein [Chlamydiota bacterium]MBI3266866.1 HipA domain-containing protein [Chlamydiota bacterium]
MSKINICAITYGDIPSGEHYSLQGLKLLSPQLKKLEPLHLTLEEQREEAAARAGKMSIQGVQVKLSARLAVSRGQFKIVDRGGTYILKPAPAGYREVPENEDLTMHLARAAGIQVPVHGLVYAKDGTRTYFIKRFDRRKSKKLYLEDFGQLLGLAREVKYDTSMEEFAGAVQRYATFPALECREFFLRTIFCFLTGNEDMHAKNFSLFSEDNHVFKLAPAYDFLNSTIVMSGKSREELAVPLAGKKSKLTRNDLIKYFGQERLGLAERTIQSCLKQLQDAFPEWERLVQRSFLSEKMRKAYWDLLTERRERLKL